MDQSSVFHSTYPMAASGVRVSASAGVSGVLAESTVVVSDDEEFDVDEEEAGSAGGGTGSMGMSMFQSAYTNLCDSVADASVYSSEAPMHERAHPPTQETHQPSAEHISASLPTDRGAPSSLPATPAGTAPSSSSLKLRVHFRCLSVSMPAVDPADSSAGDTPSRSVSTDSLYVLAEHVLITAAVNTRMDVVGGLSGSTKLEVAVREFGVFDQHAGPQGTVGIVQPLITFETDTGAARGTIISAPCIRVCVNSRTSGADIHSELKVDVLPLIASVTVDRIGFWTRAFSSERGEEPAPQAESRSAAEAAEGTGAAEGAPVETVLEFKSIRLVLVSDAVAYAALMDPALGERGNYLKLLKASLGKTSAPYQWKPVGSLVWAGDGTPGGDARSTGGARSSMLERLREALATDNGGSGGLETPLIRLGHHVPHCGLLVNASDVCIRINPSAPPVLVEDEEVPGPGAAVEMDSLTVHLTVNSSDARRAMDGVEGDSGLSSHSDHLISYDIFSASSRPASEIARGGGRVTIDLANHNSIPNTAFSIQRDDDDGNSSCSGPDAQDRAKMTMVHISAYKVAMVSQKYQYDLMLLVSGAISPVPEVPEATATATATATSTAVPPPKNNKFGIWFSATVAVIQLSQDEVPALGASPVPGTEPTQLATPVEYTVAIREPMIQVLVVDSCTRVCINANDISIYERPTDLEEPAREGNADAWAANVGPRWGDQRYNIPLIHRTKLSCPWDCAVDVPGGSAPSADALSLPHVFEFEMVLDESMQGAACHKRMGVRLALQDVTLRYDLSSVWLLNIIDILTPAIDERVHEAGSADEGEGGESMDMSAMLESDVFHDPLSDEAAVRTMARRKYERRAQVGSGTDADADAMASAPATYRMTTISILVSRFMVDYCCPLTPSRVLFSVGLLSLDSNMNSISTQVKLKFKVHDVALHLSNQLNDGSRGYLEQAPLVGCLGEYEYPGGGAASRRRQATHPHQITEMDVFLDTHVFVQICTLDFIDLIVTINDDFSGAALCIGSTVGVCCMYACLDSLNILAKTITNWWELFKPEEEEEASDGVLVATVAADGKERLTAEQSQFRRVASGPSETPLVMPLYPANDAARVTATAATVMAGTPAPSVKPNWMATVDENAFAPRPKTRQSAVSHPQEHYVPLSRPFVPYIGGSEAAPPEKEWGMSSTMLNMRSLLEEGGGGETDGMAGSGFHQSGVSRSGIATTGGGGGLTGAMIDDFFPMPERLRESVYPGAASAGDQVNQSGVGPGSGSVDMNSSSFQQARWYPVYDSEEEGEGTGSGGADEDDGFQVYYEDESGEGGSAGGSHEDNDDGEEEEVRPVSRGGLSQSTPSLRMRGVAGRGHLHLHHQSQSQPPRLMSASIPSMITLRTDQLEDNMGGGASHPGVEVEAMQPDSGLVVAAPTPTSPSRPRHRLTPKFAPSPRSLAPMSPALASTVDVDTDEESEGEERHERWERAKSEEIDTGQNLIVLDDFCNSSTSYSMFSSAQRAQAQARPVSDRGQGSSGLGWAGSSRPVARSQRLWVRDSVAIKEEAEGSEDGSGGGDRVGDLGDNVDIESVVSDGADFEERVPQHKFGFQGTAASSSGLYMTVLGSWMGSAGPHREPEAMEMSSFGQPSRMQKLAQMEQSRLVSPSNRGLPVTSGEGGALQAHYGDSGSEDGNREVITPDLDSSIELGPGVDNEEGADRGMSRSVMGPVRGDGILRRADDATAADEDYQRAWRGQAGVAISQDSLQAGGAEQQARWFEQADQIKIISHHVPLVTAQQNSSLECEVLEIIHADAHPPDKGHGLDQGHSREGKLVPTCIVNLQLSIRLRLFAGCDWENSREKATPVPMSSNSTDTGIPTRQSPQSAREGKRDIMRSQVDAFLGEADSTALNTARNAGAMSSSGRLFKEGRSVKPLARDGEADRKEEARAQARAHAKAYQSREMQDMLEVSVKDAQVYIRLYPRTVNSSGGGCTTPCERIMCNAQDILVSYAKVGLPNTKILGCYKSSSHPRQCNVPFISVGLVGYLSSREDQRGSVSGKGEADIPSPDGAPQSSQEAVEYRLNASVIPVRVFLDENVINFVKDTLELSQQLVVSGVAVAPGEAAPKPKPTPADAVMFFQMVQVRPIDIKIDYNPSPVDFTALQQGDYLQILNLCPLDGLSITLGAVLLTGISNNNNALIDKVLEIWTDHIVKHQLHRIVTGATPFGRGISNITAGIQNLLMIPLREFNNRNRAAPHPPVDAGSGRSNSVDTDATSAANSAVVRQVTRGTASLLTTVTKEALHYSHKLTMMVAHGIADLATENRENVPRAQRLSSHIQQRARTRQPQNIQEGLRMGMDSMAREVHTAMDTVVMLPIRQYKKTGNSRELVKEVVTALPIAILRPIGGAAEAVSYTLLGMRNRLDPNARAEEEDLYQVDHARPTVSGRGITGASTGDTGRPVGPVQGTGNAPVPVVSPFTPSGSSHVG